MNRDNINYRVIKLSSGCRFILEEEGLLPSLRDEIYYQFNYLGEVVSIELGSDWVEVKLVGYEGFYETPESEKIKSIGESMRYQKLGDYIIFDTKRPYVNLWNMELL